MEELDRGPSGLARPEAHVLAPDDLLIGVVVDLGERIGKRRCQGFPGGGGALRARSVSHSKEKGCGGPRSSAFWVLAAAWAGRAPTATAAAIDAMAWRRVKFDMMCPFRSFLPLPRTAMRKERVIRENRRGC